MARAKLSLCISWTHAGEQTPHSLLNVTIEASDQLHSRPGSYTPSETAPPTQYPLNRSLGWLHSRSGHTRITYLLTPWSRVLLEKLTGSQSVKKFPAFCGTRRFITAFTSARHLSLSRARLIQSMPPQPSSWIHLLTNSLDAVVSDPDLYRLLRFQVPNLLSLSIA
jgi:hypothetical protein